MACTIVAAAPVVARPATALKAASRNTFAARVVSNGTVKKTTAMQGEGMGLRAGLLAARACAGLPSPPPARLPPLTRLCGLPRAQCGPL